MILIRIGITAHGAALMTPPASPSPPVPRFHLHLLPHGAAYIQQNYFNDSQIDAKDCGCGPLFSCVRPIFPALLLSGSGTS